MDFLDRYPFELSGGMRQRAAIAMALVMKPALIILDEPTSALDVLTQANIMNVLKRIKREVETTFILITHDIATSESTFTILRRTRALLAMEEMQRTSALGSISYLTKRSRLKLKRCGVAGS